VVLDGEHDPTVCSVGSAEAQRTDRSPDLHSDRLDPTQARATHDDTHEGAAKPRGEIDPRQKIGRRHRIGAERKAVRRTPCQNELRVLRGGDESARVDGLDRPEEACLERDDVTADPSRDRDRCWATVGEPAIRRRLTRTQLAQATMERVRIDSDPDCSHSIVLETIPDAMVEASRSGGALRATFYLNGGLAMP
jgi:hypothetical protein